MAKFPEKESVIAALAETMIMGLKNNLAIYPAPPVKFNSLLLKYRRYQSAALFTTAIQADAAACRKEKEQAFARLKTAMKKNLRYAENTVKDDPAKLKLLGWSIPAASEKKCPPGQVRCFRAVPREEAGVSLCWQPPAVGGTVEVYQVQGRPCGGQGDFKPLKTEVNRETTIQLAADPGDGWELRVVAINACGNGPQSNTQVIHTLSPSIV